MERFFSSTKNKDIKNNVVEVDIDKIRPNPYQPRKAFDLSSIYELAESIKHFGVIQPLSVRKAKKGAFELIAGERRLRACAYLKMQKVPVIVVDMNDNDSAVVALIENLQRKDLTFFEEAEAYFHLITEHGLTQEELSKKVGKNQSTVANKLRLLKLPKDVKEIIKDHKLTERHARAFLRLSDPERRLHAISLAVRGKMNVAATEELVEAMLREDEIRLALQEIPEDKPHGKRRFVLKDIRLFYNSIEHAMDIVRLAGIKIQSRRIETDECTELRILIHKGS